MNNLSEIFEFSLWLLLLFVIIYVGKLYYDLLKEGEDDEYINA